MTSLLDDLEAEHAELDAAVVETDLSLPTPAEGWTVGDTIAHLWFFDREATTALTDAGAFARVLDEAVSDPDGYMARPLGEGRDLGDNLPQVWRETRRALLDAL